MTTRGILSIAELARINDTARYVYDVIKKGPLKVMPLGDSLMAGADGSTSMSGLRLPIFTLWHLLGVPVTSVGDIFGTAADNRYLYNTLGQGGTNAVSISSKQKAAKLRETFFAAHPTCLSCRPRYRRTNLILLWVVSEPTIRLLGTMRLTKS